MNLKKIIAGIIFFIGIFLIAMWPIHLGDHGDVSWVAASVFVGLFMCIIGGILDRSPKK